MAPAPDLREIEFQMRSLAEREAMLELRIKELENREQARETKQADDDRVMLIRGIAVLGVIVSTLGGIIWAYRRVILGDAP